MINAKGKDGRFHYLYRTVHLPTNRYYIGKRSEKKLSSYLGSGRHLKNAIRKYGLDQFSKTVLCYFESGDAAYDAEKAYITREMVDSPSCFNQRFGGDGFGMGLSNICHDALKDGRLDPKRGRAAERAKNRELWAQKLADSGSHPWSTENNPTFARLKNGTHNFQNVKPWDHYIASTMSKNTWSKADEIYTVWLKEKPTYSLLYKQCKDMFDFDFIRQNLMVPVRYFEAGWIPSQDPDWLQFKQTHKVHSDE